MDEQILKYFSIQKKQIGLTLQDFFQHAKKNTLGITTYHTKVFSQLYPFIMNGKMIRGGLVILSTEMFGGKPEYDTYNIAAAIEVFQSFLLIHDDIMDNDYFRRGKKTIFSQYIDQDNVIKNKTEYAKAMGICVGDIALFLGLNLVNLNCFPADIRFKLINTLSIELTKVGLAQMDDIAGGFTSKELTKEEIEKIYLFKTARYTFSLPFITGAIIMKQNNSVIHQLDKLGEYMGLIFQMRDDELNIFSRENESGKSVGSDIIQNKKTLLRYILYQKSSREDKKILNSFFGKHKISNKDYEMIKYLINKYQVLDALNKIINVNQKKSSDIIRMLPISNFYKKLLKNLLLFITTRTK